MPYLKINYDRSLPAFEPLNLPDDSMAWLNACYNVIGCDSIDIVDTFLSGLVLIIDDDPTFSVDLYNRFNFVASFLFGSSCDPIVGDAILARIDDNLDVVPLTTDDVDRLRRLFFV